MVCSRRSSAGGRVHGVLCAGTSTLRPSWMCSGTARRGGGVMSCVVSGHGRCCLCAMPPTSTVTAESVADGATELCVPRVSHQVPQSFIHAAAARGRGRRPCCGRTGSAGVPPPARRIATPQCSRRAAGCAGMHDQELLRTGAAGLACGERGIRVRLAQVGQCF